MFSDVSSFGRISIAWGILFPSSQSAACCHGVTENRRRETDACLVGAAFLYLLDRFGLAIDAAQELIRSCLAGFA
jgi:hypothetical protein